MLGISVKYSTYCTLSSLMMGTFHKLIVNLGKWMIRHSQRERFPSYKGSNKQICPDAKQQQRRPAKGSRFEKLVNSSRYLVQLSLIDDFPIRPYGANNIEKQSSIVFDLIDMSKIPIDKISTSRVLRS